MGYDVMPQPLRAGEPAEITTHWRLHRASLGAPDGLGTPPAPSTGPTAQGTRFGDDYPLVGFLPELGSRRST